MPARKGQKYKPRTTFAVIPVVLTCALCPRKFTRNHSQHKYCDECRSKGQKIKMAEWHEKTDPERERRRANYKAYYAENAAMVIAKTKMYSQTEQGREARRTAYQNQKLYNAKKVAARQIVRMAIRGGILMKQPCNHCGSSKVEAHHEDYDKPLNVLWLCFSEHRRIHRERRDGPSTLKTRDKLGRFEPFAAED